MRHVTLLLVLLITSCAYSPIRGLNYKKYNIYSAENSGNFKYSDLGPIYSSQSSWIFTSCKELATQVITEMVADAKDKGGNAVVNVRWRRDEVETAMPTCKKRYGYAALFIVGLMLPWTKNVEANGTAAKIDDTMEGVSSPNTEVLVIPKNKSERRIAEEYVAKLEMPE